MTKLVKDGFVKREKKQMIPTENGMKLITILPDVVKSPKLTADWENEFTLVSKGEVAAKQFMSGIEAMVTDLVKTKDGKEIKGFQYKFRMEFPQR